MIQMMLEPGEVVSLRVGSRPLDVDRYYGGEFGFEVEVEPGSEMTVVRFPD